MIILYLDRTKFVGLKNFVKAFHDRVFWISIKNSVIFVVVVPIIQILSILLAVLVNKKLPGIGIFRTLFLYTGCYFYGSGFYYVGIYFWYQRYHQYSIKRIESHFHAAWILKW